MLNLQTIHKPTTIADALELLNQPDTVALAGGTALNADARDDVTAVVDLSAIDLSYIRESNGAIAMGATTTLAAIEESPILRALANGVLAQAAHRSAGSILRNQATVAGTLISEPNSILAVALLALDARVTIVGKETRTVEIAEFLGELKEIRELKEKSIVTEIMVTMANPRASLQTVARTPSDKPIVSVCVSAQIEIGIARNARIAFGGVGEIAVRANAAEKLLEGQTLGDVLVDKSAGIAADELSPQGDFRGSAEYRKEMAVVLTRRALKELLKP